MTTPELTTQGTSSLVTFREPDGTVRAVLQFLKIPGGWHLTALRNC